MIRPVSSEQTDASPGVARSGGKTRIVVLGGGFGGVYAARRLERLFARQSQVEIVLVSRDNFFLMTPLLFEACSGAIQLRDCSVPIRAFLRRSRFIEATVGHVDVEQRIVHASAAEGEQYQLPYDQLVVALGATTNRALIPGSEFAFTFKTLADAIVVRNHMIERFERADTESNPDRRRALLTFVVIGGGLVGVEVFGELTFFVNQIIGYYRTVHRQQVRFFLFQGGKRILPEVDAKLSDYAVRVLSARPGVHIHTDAPVQSIEPGKVHVNGQVIESETIILAAGIVPCSTVSQLPPQVHKDKHGRVLVDSTLRSHSHPNLWALGDCAAVPGPDGKPYPYLAQFALREARTLARNIHNVLQGKPPAAFAYRMLGILASLGHRKGLGVVLGVRIRGFFAWWVRRTYYLIQMPEWSRRFRLVTDWTFALLFRPDITKIDVDTEPALVQRNNAAGTFSLFRYAKVEVRPGGGLGATFISQADISTSQEQD